MKIKIIYVIILIFTHCLIGAASYHYGKAKIIKCTHPIFFKKGDAIPAEWYKITSGKFSIREFAQDAILYDNKLFWNNTSEPVIMLDDLTEEGGSDVTIEGTAMTPMFHGSWECYWKTQE